MAVSDVDPDYLRIDIAMADGAFAGSTDLYESPDVAATLAGQLRGFPTHPSDRREVVLGSFDPKMAGGAIRLLFRCVDRSGHAVVEAELVDQPSDGSAPRSVSLRMPVGAASVDAFVAELEGWSPRSGGRALLQGAG